MNIGFFGIELPSVQLVKRFDIFYVTQISRVTTVDCHVVCMVIVMCALFQQPCRYT